VTWTPIVDGFPNGRGSEGGLVRIDEEHPLGARITLEEGGQTAPWAITCGISGWMCHTAFCSSEAEGISKMATMKDRLETILRMLASEGASTDRVVQAIGQFVGDF
jgi:hypothetical protein